MSNFNRNWGPLNIDSYRMSVQRIESRGLSREDWTRATMHSNGYWASESFIERVEQHAAKFTEITTANVFKGHGIVMLERPIPHAVVTSDPVWGFVWTTRKFDADTAVVLRAVCKSEAGFLYIAGTYSFLVDDTGHRIAQMGMSDIAQAFVQFTVAMHSLMRDEATAELKKQPLRGGRAKPKRNKKGQQQKPTTYLINLRGSALPAEPHDKTEASEPTGRHVNVRYEVREHTRNQPYGPGRSLRRLIQVAAHVRGPEGAPFQTKNYRVTGEAA